MPSEAKTPGRHGTSDALIMVWSSPSYLRGGRGGGARSRGAFWQCAGHTALARAPALRAELCSDRARHRCFGRAAPQPHIRNPEESVPALLPPSTGRRARRHRSLTGRRRPSARCSPR
eukprot:scaffold11959_cov126-Isochrysis_galbana.AAC.5